MPITGASTGKAVPFVAASLLVTIPRVVESRAEVCSHMKVRIVIRMSPVVPEVTLGGVCRQFRHLPCLLGHHDEMMDFGAGKLALKCARCGWKSSGWSLDEKPPLRAA